MRNQIPFTVFVFLCFLACDRSRPKPMIMTTIQVDKPVNSSTNIEKIFGDWGIYVSNGRYCNACPTISFKHDQTGIVRSADSAVLKVLKWTINDSTIIVSAVDERPSSLIPDGTYSFRLTKFKDFQALVLTEVKRNLFYTLRH
jgi:hypothetical protein